MALLNYTTTIATEKTVGEIQRLLAKNGARSIQVDFDGEGEPIALAFQVETKVGVVGYRLPSNIDAVCHSRAGGPCWMADSEGLGRGADGAPGDPHGRAR
jgi:hypothetical protein